MVFFLRSRISREFLWRYALQVRPPPPPPRCSVVLNCVRRGEGALCPLVKPDYSSPSTDPAVRQLCCRLLQLPASYVAFPSCLLMAIYDARCPQDPKRVVLGAVLEVLSNLSQRTEQASGTLLPRDLDQCKRLLENVLTNLYHMVSRQEGGVCGLGVPARGYRRNSVAEIPTHNS